MSTPHSDLGCGPRTPIARSAGPIIIHSAIERKTHGQPAFHEEGQPNFNRGRFLNLFLPPSVYCFCRFPRAVAPCARCQGRHACANIPIMFFQVRRYCIEFAAPPGERFASITFRTVVSSARRGRSHVQSFLSRRSGTGDHSRQPFGDAPTKDWIPAFAEMISASKGIRFQMTLLPIPDAA